MEFWILSMVYRLSKGTITYKISIGLRESFISQSIPMLPQCIMLALRNNIGRGEESDNDGIDYRIWFWYQRILLEWWGMSIPQNNIGYGEECDGNDDSPTRTFSIICRVTQMIGCKKVTGNNEGRRSPCCTTWKISEKKINEGVFNYSLNNISIIL